MTRPAHRLSPRLLELESRLVPAGNVTVTQIGTQLRVIGDAANNNFTIQGRGPGVVEIQGTGTTINGSNAKVTATGVEWLRVFGRANDDTIKTRDLEVARVNVFGEGGNDVLELSGTRGVDLPPSYFDDRGLDLFVSGGFGDDAIRIDDTKVLGNFAAIGVEGDEGRNTITISNTNVEPAAGDWGGFLYLSMTNGYGSVEGANEITIRGLTVDALGPDMEPGLGWVPWIVDINGADGDDTIRLRDWNLAARGNDTDLFGDMYVYGWGGTDRIEVENAAWSMTNTAGIGRYNQVFTIFDADRVDLRNIRHEGGVFDGAFSSVGLMAVVAADADLRNVAVTSATGAAQLNLFSPFDDPTRAASFNLANVTVRGGDIGGFTGIYTGDGDDTVRATNCELGEVDILLGEGNDRLTFVNVTFDAPHYVFEEFDYEYGGILTGGGDDTVSLTNCDGETVYIDTGDGDDTVTLKNCVFVSGDLFGGDGDDDLNLINCNGLFTIDGFEE